jgi:type II secretory pathway component PulK
MRAAPRDERGFALLAVLLVLAIMGVLGAEFAYITRLEASAVRSYKDGIAASHLAEAAIAQATRELAQEWAVVHADEHGELSFVNRDRIALRHLPRRDVPLGPGHFSYSLRDEESLLNLNTAQPGRLEALLDALGVQRNVRDEIVDSIQDWRDPNEEHRVNGAESEDYYLKLPVPYRARNANVESVRELLQIRGVTPEIFYGLGGKGGLNEAVTVRSVGQVNLNTAAPIVMRAMGLSDAEIGTVLSTRRDTPYITVPGQFGGRGFAVTTRTFRVLAEGIVHGKVGARITAVLRRQSESDITVLEWSSTQ